MAKKEIYYTVCPVGNATYIAAERGFLNGGLNGIGYAAIKLQSLSPENWNAHYTHENDRLFRDGGNTPPLWAKSRGTGLVLIGLNLVEGEQAILVRKDSALHDVRQLRGARLALPLHVNASIDHQKASVQQGFENALYANGIGSDEVEWISFVTEKNFRSSQNGETEFSPGVDIEAVERGEADAAFVKLTEAERILETGKFRRLYDVTKGPADFPPVNNEYPELLTVSKKLAEEEPEAVVAFLKQVITAARWAGKNQKEAEELLAVQTHGKVSQYRKAFSPTFYQKLEPGFPDAGLRALDYRARFLYDHGFLESRVDVYEWADPGFLKQALKELDGQ